MDNCSTYCKPYYNNENPQILSVQNTRNVVLKKDFYNIIAQSNGIF